jgi:zeaxanthin glucosyltransferase
LIASTKTFCPQSEGCPKSGSLLAKGNNIECADLGPIPSNVIVVDQAPQIELLQRATLCITHAGLNTALESLAYGVPMVAIPIGYDQFGVAACIAYHGSETIERTFEEALANCALELSRS